MIEWGAKQADLITAPFDRTLDWLEGTPRSGKTTAGIMRFARHLIKSEDNIHLVTAYSAEQAFRLIMDGDGMGLLHIFKGACRTSHDDSGGSLSRSRCACEPIKRPVERRGNQISLLCAPFNHPGTFFPVRRVIEAVRFRPFPLSAYPRSDPYMLQPGPGA